MRIVALRASRWVETDYGLNLDELSVSTARGRVEFDADE